MATAKKKTAARKAVQSIKQRNAKFKAMTKAEKRVAIAKDVIRQLGRGTLAAHHIYFGVTINALVDGDPTGLDKALKGVRCDVCAIGALVVAGIRRFNGVSVADALDADLYTGPGLVSLDRYFGHDQLRRIECFYELGNSWWDENHINRYEPRSLMWEGLSSTERMVAIMRNIIRNKGTFRPETEPV